jgi:crotonobetainyl-CoA:carnitine CoA-transferase CaiB-like acyl-CoA transferase
MSEPRLPLSGIKVLDLSRVLAGPWCAMTLADLGADVIKVEHPVRGDDTRGWAPFKQGQSAYYLFLNRNKRSVALDITDTAVQDMLRAYIAEADIVIENYRFGTLAKYRLDYASAKAINPRIIYCSVTGYGHTSPMADRPGYDFVAQAEGGLMAATGEIEGRPMKVGVAVADLFSGMNATQSVLAALIARDRYGIGQHIDIALLDGQVSAMLNVSSEYLVTGVPPARFGNAHPAVVPYEAFEAKDGYFVLAVGNDLQFGILCRQVIGRPEWADDEKFVTNAARVINRVELADGLNAIFQTRPIAEWLELLTECGVPYGKIRRIDEVLNAPEVIARDMVWTVEHPVIGTLRLVGSPLKLSETPVRRPSAPPLLGEHTDEVLSEVFGLSEAALGDMKARGVAGRRTK